MNSKLAGYIIFFSIFFTIYGLVNYYVFYKIGRIIPQKTVYKSIYIALCIIISFSFIAGRIIENSYVCSLSKYLIWIGSFWMAYMIYLSLSFLIVDVVSVSDRIFHWLPYYFKTNSYRFRTISVLGIFVLSTIVVFIGYFNSKNPHIKKIFFLPQKTKSGFLIIITFYQQK